MEILTEMVLELPNASDPEVTGVRVSGGVNYAALVSGSFRSASAGRSSSYRAKTPQKVILPKGKSCMLSDKSRLASGASYNKLYVSLKRISY